MFGWYSLTFGRDKVILGLAKQLIAFGYFRKASCEFRPLSKIKYLGWPSVAFACLRFGYFSVICTGSWHWCFVSMKSVLLVSQSESSIFLFKILNGQKLPMLSTGNLKNFLIWKHQNKEYFCRKVANVQTWHCLSLAAMFCSCPTPSDGGFVLCFFFK